MLSLPVLATGSVLLTWLLAFVIVAGCGFLLLRAFGVRADGATGIVSAFWLGWAGAVALLQAWHLFLPVRWPAMAVVVALALGGWATAGRYWWRAVSQERIDGGRWLAAAFAISTVWLACRATQRPHFYDVGLYHQGTILWIESCATVPGLANLHGRFGFNSAYFLYAALIDSGPISATHVSSGLLLLPLLAESLAGWGQVWRGSTSPSHVLAALLLAPIFDQATGLHVSSTSPDLAIFVLGAVVTIRLATLICEPRSPNRALAVATLIAAAIVGISVKLSFAAYGLAAIGVFAFVEIHRRGLTRLLARRRLVWGLAALSATLLTTWLIAGVLLSGLPLYPLTTGGLAVGWRVPNEQAVAFQELIVGWARAPGMASYRDALGNWSWVGPWAARIGAHNRTEVVVPLVCALAAAVIAAYRWRTRSQENANSSEWLILVPALVSLVFWFASAPEPRFLGVALAILAPLILSLTIRGLGEPTRTWIRIGALLTTAAFSIALVIPAPWRPPPWGLRSPPPPPVNTFDTRSGLMVYVPTIQDQCWDSPLPCTPNPDLQLELRRLGDVCSGFRIRPAAPTAR